MSNLDPSMLGQAGKFLTTDGQIASWATLPASASPTVTAANNGTSLSGTTVVLGNAAGATTAVLTSSREIPTATFDLFMSGTGKFGIGRAANQPPQALLHVGTGSTTGTVGVNSVILGTPNSSANIGASSVIAGNNNRAVGDFSFVGGQINNVYTNSSTSFGAANTIGVAGQDPALAGRESFAVGFSNIVRGTNSAAFGNQCTVLGGVSVAFGSQSQANDTGTLASGNKAIATGAFATSIGDVTLASGLRSQAFGYGTISQGQQQLAIGNFNKTSGNNSGVYAANDNLFVIGNGNITLANGGNPEVITRRNAFSVQFDGSIQLQNNLLAGTIPNPNDVTMCAIMFKDNVRYEWDTTLATWVRKDGQTQFADNAAAIAGGLPIGAFYRTGDILKVVHV